jgi:hypothetical protein
MDRPFVASFSGERDSLGHWRSYCPQGNGVCIGFKTASIKGAYLEGAEKGMCLTPLDAVSYLRPDNLKTLDGMINGVLASSDRLIADIEKASGTNATRSHRIGCMRAQFEFRAGITKHESFKDEREYRLVAALFGQEELVSYRPSRSTFVPFLKMRLPDPAQASSASPRARPLTTRFIDSVIIGPTPHPKLSAEAVMGMLRSKGFSVPVEISSVPFRDW